MSNLEVLKQRYLDLEQAKADLEVGYVSEIPYKVGDVGTLDGFSCSGKRAEVILIKFVGLDYKLEPKYKISARLLKVDGTKSERVTEFYRPDEFKPD